MALGSLPDRPADIGDALGPDLLRRHAAPDSVRRGRLWLAPAAGAGVGILVGAAALAMDGLVLSGQDASVPVFVASADTARTILSVTVTTIATLVALVLTIVTVVLQLASDKYSHRALRTFLRDAQSHVFLFTFSATFSYALVVLLGLDATLEGRSESVAGVTIPIAFVGALTSLAVFVRYIDHIVHASRGTSIIARIGDETRVQLDDCYPEDFDPDQAVDRPPPDGPADLVVANPEPGVVDDVDRSALVEAARALDAIVVMAVAPGDFVPGGATLLEVHGTSDVDEDLARHVTLDAEPTITGDVRFGLRLLVDIAENAISPGINDPTTAVQCLDQIHDLLRRLGTRRLERTWWPDDRGDDRLHVPAVSWDVYVALACEEIRLYGEGDLQVVRRLHAMLEDLSTCVPAARRVAVDDQLVLLEAAAERGIPAEQALWRADAEPETATGEATS